MAQASLFACVACGKEKSLSEFYSDFRLKRGHRATCNECLLIQSRAARNKTRERKCVVEMCNRPQMARGLCGMHYMRKRTTGSVGEVSPLVYKNIEERPACIEEGCNEKSHCHRRCEEHYRRFAWRAFGQCKIDGCGSHAITKRHGFCRMHDARRRRWGDPLALAPKKIGPGINCSIHGCKEVVIAKKLCALHYGRLAQRGDALWQPEVIPEGTTRHYRGGYVAIKCTGHPEARMGGVWAVEHRKVMSDVLGRKLRDNENVHHKNGNRSDNRPENLELWVKSQPSGQRPEDLVAWAEQILSLYKAEVNGKAKTKDAA